MSLAPASSTRARAISITTRDDLSKRRERSPPAAAPSLSEEVRSVRASCSMGASPKITPTSAEMHAV
jgi:hypothetical protein